MKGFTLVELVIVIAVVIILSVVSVPIYRNYTEKAKLTEAYALLGAILSAQKAYYSEYGNFLISNGTASGKTAYDPVLGVDARGNKYFTWFDDNYEYGGCEKYFFHAWVNVGKELLGNSDTVLVLQYNITRGSLLHGYPSKAWDSLK